MTVNIFCCLCFVTEKGKEEEEDGEEEERSAILSNGAGREIIGVLFFVVFFGRGRGVKRPSCPTEHL